MGRPFAAVIALAWLSAQPLAPRAGKASDKSLFRLPEAVSVSDVEIPTLSIANGTVVLDVRISEQGEVEDIQVRRDIASETEEAVRSVKTWKFEPAKSNGKAATSRMTVAVTFNPPSPLGAEVPLPALREQDDEDRIKAVFQPPEVARATFPISPYTAFAPGTAIFEVSINEAGKATSSKVLRDAPPFTTPALQAIEHWEFLPATLSGKPVKAKVVLVFCFRLPIGSWH
jgi:TonB family protein